MKTYFLEIHAFGGIYYIEYQRDFANMVLMPDIRCATALTMHECEMVKKHLSHFIHASQISLVAIPTDSARLLTPAMRRTLNLA